MRTRHAFLATVLAFLVPAAGCATTHLAGEYSVVPRSETRATFAPTTLARGSQWQFLWGLIDTGRFDLDQELKHHVRTDEVVTDLEIRERLSIGGFFLWLITAGIVSHHSLVAEGSVSKVKTPEPAVREKEPVVVPSSPPAASEKEKEKAP